MLIPGVKIIGELKNKYAIKDIEGALILYFLNINNISVKNNALIKSVINESDKVKTNEITKILSHHLCKLNLNDLINTFELLIPDEDKKLNGAFFTPSIITEYIASETIKSNDLTICDPSCGCGAFLVAAANHMNKAFGINYYNIIRNNIFGVDISDYSVRRAKIILALLMLENGEDVADINFNIINADSLKTTWQRLFPEIFKKGGFDAIIGNPPYVKYQDLSPSLRKDLFNNWQTLKKGTYNLYFAFFELGINILKKDGILGYITPNNYFTSLSGLTLREYLTHNKLLTRIIDFNHLKVFNVQTYTCITLLTKRENEEFLYEKIDKYENLTIEALKRIKYSTINISQLNNRKWRLLRSADQENIKNIENMELSLRDLVDIRVGIATCKDNVYFVDGLTYANGYYNKHYKGTDYPIEAGITKPIVKVSDFKSQKDINDNKRRIIFPYIKNGGKIELLSENTLKNKYPECYKYLLAAKEELNSRDKGRTDYPNWYAYARTQGLNFWGRKLLTPTFSAEPRFLIEDDRETLFCNGYAIFEKESANLFHRTHIDLDALAKILNSKIMGYYVSNTSVQIEGGYPCYQKNFIEHFKLPLFSSEEIEYLKRENNKNKLDAFLADKYRVNI